MSEKITPTTAGEQEEGYAPNRCEKHGTKYFNVCPDCADELHVENPRKVKWTHCRYCGARLVRDSVGQHCTTRNCQWEYGLPKEDDTPTLEREKVGK